MGPTIQRRTWLSGALALAASPALAETAAARHHGVLIRASNLDRALQFYGDGLGLPLADFRPREGWARFVANMPIYLQIAPGGRPQAPGVAASEITFQSIDLAQTMRTVRAAGGSILAPELYEVAVGRSFRFADPDGTIHHCLQTTRAAPPFVEPRVYNSGFEVPAADIPAVRRMMETGLGLKAMTERYFPPSVPYLEADGGFAMMLHHHQPFEPDHAPRVGPAATDLGTSQVFIADDLEASARRLSETGARRLTPRALTFPLGRRIAFATPGGAPFELWSWR